MGAIGNTNIKEILSKNIEIIIISLVYYWYINRYLPYDKGLEYSYFYYLVDYENGFIKRGLIGEIFRLLGVSIYSYKIIVICKAIFFFLWFLIIKVLKKINFKNKAIFLVLVFFILLNPSLLKNYWIDLGRFDILGAIATCLMILSPKKYSSILLFISTPLLLFIHEGQLFLFIPSIIFSWILKNRYLIQQKKLYLPFYLLFLVVCTVFISIYGNTNMPITIFKKIIDAKNIENYKYFFYDNLFSGNVLLDIKDSLLYNITHFRLWVYGTASILYTVYVMHFFLKYFNIKISRSLSFTLFFLGTINISMVFLGVDGYRWISNTSFALMLNIFALLCSIEDKKEMTIKNIISDNNINYKFAFIILSFLIICNVPYIGITSV